MTGAGPVHGFEDLGNLGALLARHGLPTSEWVELPQRGFSGARIHTRTGPDGTSYVVKTTSADTDWIMRATSDHGCREAALAAAPFLDGGPVGSPAIGSARDGGVHAILMRDISDCLLSDDVLNSEQLEQIWVGMTHLHALPAPSRPEVGWCSIEDRLTLFEPRPEKLRDFRIGTDILEGWQLFFDRAPADVVALVRALFDDLTPLRRALAELPAVPLHGDLKLDNIGIRPDGSLELIDWSMPMIAPAAIDLGWFLAMNSRSLPVPLADAVPAYLSCSDLDPRLHERHELSTVLCGLLIRGWRKGLDAAAGEPAELRWWCDRARAAADLL